MIFIIFSVGLILPSGEINWNCPCLGGMASGPCGVEFREAFSCFHYSKSEPKGSECFDSFRKMQDCMSKYPQLYPSKDDDDTDENSTEDFGGMSMSGAVENSSGTNAAAAAAQGDKKQTTS